MKENMKKARWAEREREKCRRLWEKKTAMAGKGMIIYQAKESLMHLEECVFVVVYSVVQVTSKL